MPKKKEREVKTYKNQLLPPLFFSVCRTQWRLENGVEAVRIPPTMENPNARAAAEVTGTEAAGAVVTPFDDGGLSDDVMNAVTEQYPEAFW